MRNRIDHTPVLALILALIFVGATVANAAENGWHPKFRVKHTREPAFVMRGTVYADDAAVQGEVYSSAVEIDSTDGFGEACSPSQSHACWLVCEAELDSPYCCQVGTYCEATGGGAVSCHCAFFCASAGGHQYKPKALEVRRNDSEER